MVGLLMVPLAFTNPVMVKPPLVNDTVGTVTGANDGPITNTFPALPVYVMALLIELIEF